MLENKPRATVYYDGSCPLCATEIQHYRNLDSDRKLRFADVSAPDTELPENLTRQQAMARFHVMSDCGTLISGARAFAEVWTNLPRWRWAARLARIPGAIYVLEAGYSVTLRVRPAISALVGRLRPQRTVSHGRDGQSLH